MTLLDASLGDYLVPVNADVPDIDVIFVGQPDSMMPTGTKGVGELALIGMAAAVANAVYHATPGVEYASCRSRRRKFWEKNDAS